MRSTFFATVLATLALASGAYAQFPCAPFGGYGRGMGFTCYNRNLTVSGFLMGYPAYGYGYYSPYGYPYGMRSTVIVVMPPAVVVRPTLPELELVRARDPNEVPINPDEVRVFRPRAGGLANLPPQRFAPVELIPEPKPKEPARGFEAAPRQAAPPEGNKNAENERLNTLGRDAFAAEEYGRAVERFERAILVAPEKPMSHFLLAQAQFALGKYRDAVASILAGMKLQPDWPRAKFDARELYGDNAAEYAMHLERLRLAVERNPDEPALVFLYGYQLWFSNRREEAKPFFRKAATLTDDAKPIERFLNVP